MTRGERQLAPAGDGKSAGGREAGRGARLDMGQAYSLVGALCPADMWGLACFCSTHFFCLYISFAQ